MLTIRLTRKGKKNQPFFRVVVIDKRRSSTGGRAVEDLGYLDPVKKRKSFNAERIKYWLSKGAKASGTIHNLLVTEKIIDAKKIVKKSKKPAPSASSEQATSASSGQATSASSGQATPATPAPVEAPKEEPKPEEPKA